MRPLGAIPDSHQAPVGRRLGMLLLPLLLGFGGILALTLGLLQAEAKGAKKIPAADLNRTNFGVLMNAAKVAGPMSCAECHPNANAAWMNSTHGESFKTRHRSDKARKIRKRMGIRRFRAQASVCASCHTTQQQLLDSKDVIAVAGPSCESCHGESNLWVNDHFDFGGAKTRMEEAPEHREKRLQGLEAEGMVHPSKLFDLAKRCYTCHVISNASLVEIGGHRTSSDFDLITWMEGEVRHNFVDSAGKENAEASVEDRRELLVIGTCMEIVSGIRQLENAAEDGDLFVDGEARIEGSIKYLKRIAKALGEKAPKEFAEFFEVTESLDEKHISELRGTGYAVIEVADKVEDAARALASALQMKTAKLSELDQFLPKASEYQGKVWKPSTPKGS